MRAPLKHQCESPMEAYDRHRQERKDERAMLDRITRDSEHIVATHATAGRPDGDQRVLRAIPVIAKGVAGAIPGTTPHSDRCRG